MRPDGTQRPYVIIWVVRAGDDIFVRSAYGADNPWFRRAVASGIGRVKAGGLEPAVTFERAGDEVMDAVDSAYHAKYGRYGRGIVEDRRRPCHLADDAAARSAAGVIRSTRVVKGLLAHGRGQ